MSVARPGLQATERPHVNDFSLAWSQELHGFTRDEKCSTRVRSKDVVPLFERKFLELSGLVIRSVVDQDVDAAEVPGRFPDCGSHSLLIRDVAAKGFCAYAQTLQICDCLPGLAG
jgi:hypothetical protein